VGTTAPTVRGVRSFGQGPENRFVTTNWPTNVAKRLNKCIMARLAYRATGPAHTSNVRYQEENGVQLGSRKWVQGLEFSVSTFCRKDVRLSFL
jgi:hypothetical protein